MSLAGRIQFEGSRLKPASFQAVGVTLQPLPADNAIGLAPSTAVIDSDGRFEIGGVIPGRYQLVANLPGLGRAGQWQVRSSLVRGVDTSDLPVEIRPGESIRDALVVFTDRAAALSGAVHIAAGGAPDDFTVVLFPAEPQFWGPQGRRIQAVRPAADGAFAFHGLPPGDYYVAAIDDVERGEWFDPAFLQRLLPSALRIAVAEGEQKIQDIRLGGHS